MFAIPSLRYMLQNGTVLHFNEYFKFCLNDDDRVEQAIFYIAILALLTIVYVFIIKNREKLFKNIKEICIYIAIISLIFVMVLPFLSSDIFYYLGVGRLDSKYGQNPYYVTIKDFVENGDNMQYLEQDTVLAKGYENDWGNTTVVYGPVWTLICKIISGITFGNIDVALFVFKLFNMLIHILNCYVIYKLTGKKIFVLLYGLNPYMFIEGIANAHNDIYVVTFILVLGLLSVFFAGIIPMSCREKGKRTLGIAWRVSCIYFCYISVCKFTESVCIGKKTRKKMHKYKHFAQRRRLEAAGFCSGLLLSL